MIDLGTQVMPSFFHRENGATLGVEGRSCLSPPKSPLKGNLPNEYPLYRVYMELLIEGTIPRVPYDSSAF